jgi:AcrR family transcriptional regulator
MTDSPLHTVGLRERKKLATRNALNAAAVRLMTESGPDGVTVEAICAAAGVSPRTFFNYFDTKEEAIFLWDDEFGPGIAEAIRDSAADSPFTAATQAVRELFRFAMTAETWRTQRALMQAYPQLLGAALRLGRALHGAVGDGVAQRTGLPVTDLYVRTVAATVVTGARVISEYWVENPDSDYDRIFDQVFGVLESGGAFPAPERGREKR